MHIKVLALCSALTLTTGIAEAAPEKPLTYTCNGSGCEVRCKTEQGGWLTVEKARVSVTTLNHDNGNVEFFINDGGNGQRTFVISPKNLFCEITGYN